MADKRAMVRSERLFTAAQNVLSFRLLGANDGLVGRNDGLPSPNDSLPVSNDGLPVPNNSLLGPNNNDLDLWYARMGL